MRFFDVCARVFVVLNKNFVGLADLGIYESENRFKRLLKNKKSEKNISKTNSCVAIVIKEINNSNEFPISEGSEWVSLVHVTHVKKYLVHGHFAY